MKEIPKGEVVFNNASYIDPNSRLFRWKGDIYRAILPGKSEFYKNLVNSAWFKELQIKKRVIETFETDYYLEGFGSVLKHREIPVLSYCHEWPPQMLKSAAILTVEIALELVEHDLSLQDAYPWNVLFEGVKPIFVDIGSFTPMNRKFLWGAYQQFLNFFLFPLYLYGTGLYTPTRYMLLNFLDGVSYEDCDVMLPLSFRMKHPSVLTTLELPIFVMDVIKRLKMESQVLSGTMDLSRIDIKSAMRRFFNGLIKKIKAIHFPRKASVWSDYPQGEESFEKKEAWTLKQQTVSNILDCLKPRSVLDVASNRGWFSVLAAKKGVSVISVDSDESSIADLYKRALKENLNILPLVMNIVNPTPSFGWCLKQFPSAIERLRSDMTLALALMHHLVFTQWQNFERIAELFDCFTNKWLLIEFIPRDDEKSRLLLARKEDTYDWYTFENFIKVMENKYNKIEVFESFPQGRKLVLCHKVP